MNQEVYTTQRYRNARLMNIHIKNLTLQSVIMESLNIRRITTGKVASSWCLPLFEHLDNNKWIVHMYMTPKVNSEGKKVYSSKYCYAVDDEIVKNILQSESLGKAYNDFIKKNPKAKAIRSMTKNFNLDKGEGFTRKDLARKAKELEMAKQISQL